MLDTTDTGLPHQELGQPLDRRWRDRAACRGLDTELFFPGQGESVVEAKQVCARCEVRTECARYALDSGQRFGIWGGTSERDRRRQRTRLLAAAAATVESVA